MRNSYNILAGYPEGKRQLGRPRHRWKGKLEMDFKGLEGENVD
jgi:hypothetical protein